MKKIKLFKVCHECKGRGEKGFTDRYSGDFIPTCTCQKCHGKGYIK